MKVIVKKPNEKYGNIIEIDGELTTLQDIVGGYIEAVPLGEHIIICNEEGKLLGLEPNIRCMFDTIVGTIIVCDREEGELTDVSITMDKWKELIDTMLHL